MLNGLLVTIVKNTLLGFTKHRLRKLLMHRDIAHKDSLTWPLDMLGKSGCMLTCSHSRHRKHAPESR